ncbi:MAG: PepSY domain-containing protein [Lachnospiraceae bacterium]|nr:PepSY domain-containing protein [Lachnospiraceae bacterium]
MFQKASDRADNYRSGAYSLLLIGIAGLVFMILCVTGVIPLNLPGTSKIVSGVVMTLIFLIFLAVGIKSLIDAGKYASQADNEDRMTEEIHDWFIAAYSKDAIDKTVFWEGDNDRGIEADYFRRCQYIRQVIEEKYNDLSPDYTEKMIEDLYNEIYEE